MIFIIFLSLIFNSCQEKEIESKVEIKTTLEEHFKLLEYDTDKIALLSLAKEISPDTLKIIVANFNYEQDSRSELQIQDYVGIIDSLSKKLNISKKKVSSIIFSYKYEMLTQEEIGISAVEYAEELKKDDESRKYEDQ